MSIPDNINQALVIITSLLATGLVPALTSWLTARNASGELKQMIATVLSLVTAVVAVALAGSFDLTNLSATALTVLVAAQVGYQLLFKNIVESIHATGPQLGAKPPTTNES